MKPQAILFDFDGVLIESEWEGNRHIAEWLTGVGHPIDTLEAARRFAGLSGSDFTDALEAFVGGPMPDGYHDSRKAEDLRVFQAGIDPVAGALAFIASLPADLPVAVASSSRVRWIRRHLQHLGIEDRFGGHLYSGAEHVEHGKPAPDLYLHAAAALGVPIARTAIIEDSAIGVTGAAKSGAFVVGLCAGRHCGVGHADRLRELGADAVAADFVEVTRLLELAARV